MAFFGSLSKLQRHCLRAVSLLFFEDTQVLPLLKVFKSPQTWATSVFITILQWACLTHHELRHQNIAAIYSLGNLGGGILPLWASASLSEAWGEEHLHYHHSLVYLFYRIWKSFTSWSFSHHIYMGDHVIQFWPMEDTVEVYSGASRKDWTFSWMRPKLLALPHDSSFFFQHWCAIYSCSSYPMLKMER